MNETRQLPPPEEADHPDQAAALGGRLALVALVVVAQLWALVVALDAWLSYRQTQVWALLGFEALCFAAALWVWLSSPKR